jgi:hypothetical protein
MNKLKMLVLAALAAATVSVGALAAAPKNPDQIVENIGISLTAP